MVVSVESELRGTFMYTNNKGLPIKNVLKKAQSMLLINEVVNLAGFYGND